MNPQKYLRSLPFLIVTFISLFTFSVWYWLHQSPWQEYQVIDEQVSSSDLEMNSNEFTLVDVVEGIKVGDEIGGFTVTKIDFPKIYTTGEVIVTGRYVNAADSVFGPTFNVMYSSSKPRIAGDERNYWFCISNHNDITDNLESYNNKEEMVEIRIKNYIINLQESMVCDSAEFVSVVER